MVRKLYISLPWNIGPCGAKVNIVLLLSHIVEHVDRKKSKGHLNGGASQFPAKSSHLLADQYSYPQLGLNKKNCQYDLTFCAVTFKQNASNFYEVTDTG